MRLKGLCSISSGILIRANILHLAQGLPIVQEEANYTSTIPNIDVNATFTVNKVWVNEQSFTFTVGLPRFCLPPRYPSIQEKWGAMCR